VTVLPTNGSTIYVRLWSNVAGIWLYRDYTYIASGAAGSATKAAMVSPTAGTTLGTSVVFTWNNSGASAYWLDVGSSPTSGGNIYGANTGTTTSATVTNIPTGHFTVYVRLWSFVSGTWLYNDYSYTSP
jgi:serine protease